KLAVEHQRREAEDARERSSELVRHVADQLALRLFALDERAIALLEVRQRALERRRHRVERALQAADLARAVRAQAAGEVAAGDALRSVGGRADRRDDGT